MQQDFVITQKNNIWFGYFPLLEQLGFGNACSCRLHGESVIARGTLNLALHVGDDEAMVLRNRKVFADALGVQAENFTTCRQVHGAQITLVDEKLVGCGSASLADTIQETDALITALPQAPLLLFYADCTPVLLVDRRTGAIGLAHAGWRGTAAEIAAKTAYAMEQFLGSRTSDLVAAIGPCIGSCCYEVDDFVRLQMPAYAECFYPSAPGKYHLDLQRANRSQLLKAGVAAENILCASVCTSCNSELFCSHRAEHGQTGRMGVCLYRK